MGVRVPLDVLYASKEYKILLSALKSETEVAEAVAQLLDVTKAAVVAENPPKDDMWSWDESALQKHLYIFNEALLDLAERISEFDHNHQPLVDFIIQLSEHTVVDPATGKPAALTQPDEQFWIDLPLLNVTVTDAISGGRFTAEAEVGSMSSKEKAQIASSWPYLQGRRLCRHLYLVSFLAKLMASDANAPFSDARYWGPFGFQNTAWQSFHYALEEPKEPAKLWVSEAATWMICAADRIWAYSQPKFDCSKSNDFSTWKWKEHCDEPATGEWYGYSQAAWNRWYLGFQQALGKTNDADLRQLINTALAAMEKAFNEGHTLCTRIDGKDGWL